MSEKDEKAKRREAALQSLYQLSLEMNRENIEKLARSTRWVWDKSGVVGSFVRIEEEDDETDLP